MQGERTGGEIAESAYCIGLFRADSCEVVARHHSAPPPSGQTDLMRIVSRKPPSPKTSLMRVAFACPEPLTLCLWPSSAAVSHVATSHTNTNPELLAAMSRLNIVGITLRRGLSNLYHGRNLWSSSSGGAAALCSAGWSCQPKDVHLLRIRHWHQLPSHLIHPLHIYPPGTLQQQNFFPGGKEALIGKTCATAERKKQPLKPSPTVPSVFISNLLAHPRNAH